MTVIYSGQYLPITGESIFLAGCSPRKGQTLLWRYEALAYYREIGFEGTIIVPEPESGEPWADYIDVVEWEDHYLKAADKILFWIPRSISKEIYGFTSNVEFGKYLSSGKIIYGRPSDSDKNNYLDYWYKKLYSYDPFNTLRSLLIASTNHTNLFKGMEVVVTKHYAETDPSFRGDCVADLTVDGVNIYTNQDWYHDRVEQKIEGYLDCLNSMGIKYERTVRKVADCAMLND